MTLLLLLLGALLVIAFLCLLPFALLGLWIAAGDRPHDPNANPEGDLLTDLFIFCCFLGPYLLIGYFLSTIFHLF